MGSLSWNQLCCQKSCWLFISAAASAARGGKNQILTMDNGLGLVQAGHPTQSKDFNQNLKFIYLLSFRVAIIADVVIHLFNSTILPFSIYAVSLIKGQNIETSTNSCQPDFCTHVKVMVVV